MSDEELIQAYLESAAKNGGCELETVLYQNNAKGYPIMDRIGKRLENEGLAKQHHSNDAWYDLTDLGWRIAEGGGYQKYLAEKEKELQFKKKKDELELTLVEESIADIRRLKRDRNINRAIAIASLIVAVVALAISIIKAGGFHSGN